MFTSRTRAYKDPVESIPTILVWIWSSMFLAIVLLGTYVSWATKYSFLPTQITTNEESYRYYRGRRMTIKQHEALVQRGRDILRSAAD